MKIIVLGAGLVGRPMALDLASDREMDITVADIRPERLARFNSISKIQTIQADLSVAETVKKLVAPYDMVLSAVPGSLGFQTLKAIIESGKNVVDIAFFPEDMFELDELAKKYNVTAIPDMGVAPGMSNLLAGYSSDQLETIDQVIIYVGGLPKVRRWPYEYKAVFSPADVIEEYTRPARYIEHGKEVIKPALTDPELIDFDGVGTLEAFNSDGLRSIAKTIKGDYMIEKTLRYPGHIELMRVFRNSGFFDREEIEVNGRIIRPLDFTSKLLFEQWKLHEGEEDFTVMKIIVLGSNGDEKLRFEWDLLDVYDRVSGIHSMARTTGYAATMAVRMLQSGLYSRTGIIAPEMIGKDKKCVDFILDGLAKRGVVYRKKEVQSAL